MRLRGRPILAGLALLLALGACTERPTAPGVCPNFCPGGAIQVADTILRDVISRDTAFSGYHQAHEGEALPVADLPGIVVSRAIFRTFALFNRVAPIAGGPDTVAIVADSAELNLLVVRRDTNAANLTLKIHRLPLDIDSTKTFAQLDPFFADSTLVDSVNVSALLALPAVYDTTLRDSVRTDPVTGQKLRWDHSTGLLGLLLPLDASQARFLEADTGKVAFGVRVSADSRASVALGANDVFDRDASIRWYYTYDSLGTPVHKNSARESAFDSFVFQSLTPPPDPAHLVVGGVPAARSLLRVALPAFLRDTADVVRATLILVPVDSVPGAPGDSFVVVAQPVLADLGAKSPLSVQGAFFGRATVRIGSRDTVRIELTDLLRAWVFDTAAATAVFLRQAPEVSSYTAIAFFPSRVSGSGPALQVTYVRRFPFGRP